MSNFIKDASEELSHVVWPTHNESRKYMIYTVGTIIIMSLLLAIVGYLLSSGLSSVRSQFPHTQMTTTASGSDDLTERDLEQLKKAVEAKKNALSGAKIEVENGSGLISIPKKINNQ